MTIQDKLVKVSGENLKPTYSQKQVLEIVGKLSSGSINELNSDRNLILPIIPDIIKKGDIFTASDLLGKKRPYVVAKVFKENVFAIPLTTRNDEYALIPYHSRFLKPGFYGSQAFMCKKELVRQNFTGIMDDIRNLNKAIVKLRKVYEGL